MGYNYGRCFRGVCMEIKNEGTSISAGLIKQIVAKIENLEEQKAQVMQDISDVFRDAKTNGLDVPVLKQLIRLRKKRKEQVAEEEELLDIYRRALEQ